MERPFELGAALYPPYAPTPASLHKGKEVLGAQTLKWGAAFPCPPTVSPPHPPGQSDVHLSIQQGLGHQAVLVPKRRGRSPRAKILGSVCCR